MGDPERLLSNIGDSDDLERELLASIHRVEPPPNAQAEVWARLSAQIAALSLVGTAHGTAAPGSAARSGTADKQERSSRALVSARRSFAAVAFGPYWRLLVGRRGTRCA